MDAGDFCRVISGRPGPEAATLGSAHHAGPLLSARKRAMQMPVRMTFERFAPR
jgi:hypothetical protein